MTQENIEQVEKWIDEINEDYNFKSNDAFNQLPDRPIKARQVCAIMFLYDKLKDSKKNKSSFLNAEHDEIFINELDDFNDFTKDDAFNCFVYGIDIYEDIDGFRISG